MIGAMTRAELIRETERLVAEGERLQLDPSLGGLRLWLQLSDELLSRAWGSMDRYHLAWLMVGRPTEIVRGRPMTPEEEAAYVREVAAQKTAALRMSLHAVADQNMPFLAEIGRNDPGVGGARSGGRGADGAGARDVPGDADQQQQLDVVERVQLRAEPVHEGRGRQAVAE